MGSISVFDEFGARLWLGFSTQTKPETQAQNVQPRPHGPLPRVISPSPSCTWQSEAATSPQVVARRCARRRGDGGEQPSREAATGSPAPPSSSFPTKTTAVLWCFALAPGPLPHNVFPECWEFQSVGLNQKPKLKKNRNQNARFSVFKQTYRVLLLGENRNFTKPNCPV